MKITTERVERIREEFELPDHFAGASDEELLANTGSRMPIAAMSTAVGEPVLVDRGDLDFETAAKAYRAATEAAERAEERAKGLLEQAAAAGRNEYELANLLGVNRSTIRRWRGKA